MNWYRSHRPHGWLRGPHPFMQYDAIPLLHSITDFGTMMHQELDGVSERTPPLGFFLACADLGSHQRPKMPHMISLVYFT
jgi:hypothetical protein